MKKLNLEEVQKYELNILKDVAKFCDENCLTYFIAYGTLLGAARHKGFIPWDDDIDIQMPREDYEKFLQTYKSEVYQLIHPLDSRAKQSIAKVVDNRTIKLEKGQTYKKQQYLGIDIDIFPIDGQPEQEKDYIGYYEKKQSLYKWFALSIASLKHLIENRQFLYAILSCFGKFVGKNYFFNQANKMNSMYPYDESIYVGAVASRYNSIKNRMLKEWYQDFIMLEFEDTYFKAPIAYHEILTKMYGDYMKLPPEDKQKTHHSYEAFFKD